MKVFNFQKRFILKLYQMYYAMEGYLSSVVRKPGEGNKYWRNLKYEEKNSE